MILSALLLFAAPAFSESLVEARYVAKDSPVAAEPSNSHWKNAQTIAVTTDRYGKPVSGHRTEIRTVWSDKFLYVLYTCPYEKLNLIANPTQTAETNRLWNYDVAELFIGSDFQNINLYKEFEISPQGEWVDLDIDHAHPLPENGRHWNSGFEVKCRLDRTNKIWYGEMKIPLTAIAAKPVTAGTEMRVNFYRIQGPEPRTYLAWSAVNANSFHTPQAFGKIRFVK